MLDILSNLRKKKQPENTDTKKETLFYFMRGRFCDRFDEDSFDEALDKYDSLKLMSSVDDCSLSDEVKYIVQLHVEYFLNLALDSMRISPVDTNVAECETSAGAAHRLAELWCSRFSNRPHVDKVPAVPDSCQETLRVQATYFNNDHIEEVRSNVTITYTPKKYILNVRDAEKLVVFMSLRIWSQDNLTKEIAKAISDIAETDVSVTVDSSNLSTSYSTRRK